ncbi:MAG: putative NADH-flavin reductase [Bacteroidota bacterium]|nr:putative NADH-flavin reductase [Bacteroidota bacterium]
MKNIVVFGAAGRTGKYVVQYALEAGHKVTAFVLHPSHLTVSHPNLEIVAGDVLHEEEKVAGVIKGKDVVISVVGTNQIDGDAVNLMSDAVKIFVKAMNEFGIKRVLAVGGLAVLQLNETMQMIDKPDYPAQYKNIGQGHNKVYKVLRETKLDWTFVCCPDIIDGPKTGKYNVNKDYPAEGQFQIFTGDLADFILKEMIENKFLATRVGIANAK